MEHLPFALRLSATGSYTLHPIGGGGHRDDSGGDHQRPRVNDLFLNEKVENEGEEGEIEIAWLFPCARNAKKKKKRRKKL